MKELALHEKVIPLAVTQTQITMDLVDGPRGWGKRLTGCWSWSTPCMFATLVVDSSPRPTFTSRPNTQQR